MVFDNVHDNHLFRLFWGMGVLLRRKFFPTHPYKFYQLLETPGPSFGQTVPYLSILEYPQISGPLLWTKNRDHNPWNPPNHSISALLLFICRERKFFEYQIISFTRFMCVLILCFILKVFENKNILIKETSKSL